MAEDDNDLGIGVVDISVLYSDDDDIEESMKSESQKSQNANDSPPNSDFSNSSVGSTLDEYQIYLKLLISKDKRVKPIDPIRLITTKCDCGNHCDSLLSIEEICKYRILWPTNYSDRTASQYFLTRSMIHNKIFVPQLKNRHVCEKFYSAVNIYPIERIHRFVELINEGIDQPVHPNTGKHFEQAQTIYNLVKLADFISENFDPNPTSNSYMATSQYRRHSAAGEALNIPQENRRKKNFAFLYKRLTVPISFKSGNSLVKCTICCESAVLLQKRSTSEEEKKRIKKEWEEHKQKNIDDRRDYHFRSELSKNQADKYLSIVHDGMRKEGTRLPLLHDNRSKKVEDNDRLYCNLNLALIHRRVGNHSKSVGFFSPGSCYDNTTNSITSQIFFAISTCSPIPPTVFIQVDNFPGNKSFVFFAIFGYFLMRQNIIREFYISFMMPGHTHCDVDAKFGNFSSYLNTQQCGSPQELMKAFEDSIHGKAEMKQTIYEFKDKLHPLLLNYKGMKSMYDFHIFLNADGEPTIEKARFHLSETLLCGNSRNETGFSSKIFKTLPSKDLKFRIIKPKIENLEKLPNVIHKWENVISDCAQIQLLSLQEEIESHNGIEFETLLEIIEAKAVIAESESSEIANIDTSILPESTHESVSPEIMVDDDLPQTSYQNHDLQNLTAVQVTTPTLMQVAETQTLRRSARINQQEILDSSTSRNKKRKTNSGRSEIAPF